MQCSQQVHGKTWEGTLKSSSVDHALLDSVVFVCSLVGLERELQSLLILVILEILIRGDPLQDTCSTLEVVLLVGKLLFSLQ